MKNKTTRNTTGQFAALLAAAAALLAAASPALAWDVPVYLSAPGVYDFFGSSTKLVMDGKGRAVSAWMRSDGMVQRLETAIRPAGGAFGAATWVSGAGADVYGFDLQVTKKGAVTSVWDRGSFYDTRWLEVADLGAKAPAFGPAAVFSPPGEVSYSPQLGLDAKGNATVIWTKFSTKEVEAATRPAGGTFGTAETLSAPNTYTPALAVGPKGNAVVAWSQDPDPNVIDAAIRPAGGSFAPAVALTDPASDTDVIKIAMDAKGNVSLVARNYTMGVIPVGATTSGDWFSIPFDHQYGAVFKYDKAGNQYALYTASTGLGYQVRLAVRPVGATAFDPFTQISDPAAAAGVGDLLVDKKGNVRVAWSEYDGTHSRVKTAKRPAKGVFGAATTLSAAGVSGFDTKLAADKKGNVVATWVEDDGTGYNYRVASSYDPR